MSNPIQSENLTKQFLFGLPSGVFLVSNCGKSPTKPKVSLVVSPLEKRNHQWKTIVAAKANHRLCLVFKSPGDWLRCTHAISQASPKVRLLMRRITSLISKSYRLQNAYARASSRQRREAPVT